MNTTRALAAACLLPVVALSACSGRTAAAPAPATVTVTQSASPSPSGTASAPAPSASPAGASGAPVAGSDLTAPGSALRTGESAVVPLDEGDGNPGIVSLRVDRIEQGTEAELVELGVEDAAGYVPTYAWVTITAVAGSSEDLEHWGPEMDVTLPSGRPAGHLVVFGDWERCPQKGAPTGLAPGQSFTTCRVGVAPADAPATGVRFAPYDTAYSPDVDGPITWR
ncbi:hypothetical protein [Kineococcus auxinigenes]|uniref:hypothetical protein n=1 Tax=unclassified Kineococcus TaxID=2621656 RepID=UPI003D7DE815